MAYVTGTANSFPDLLTALQNACTAHGWTLSGNVLHKNTCYAEVVYVNQTYPCLRVQSGSGVDGSNALTGRSDVHAAQLGTVATGGYTSIPAGDVPFTFPVTYYAHILTNPDEVYFVVNYGATFYQFLAFGQSAASGLTGTGNWYAGTDVPRNSTINDVDLRSDGGDMRLSRLNGGLFMGLIGNPASQNGAIDHQLDSATWSVEGAWRDWRRLLGNTPSQWNQESVLLPVRVYAERPSGFVSIVTELGHARFVNLTNLDDQQIITLGTDKWKIYPWWARGTGVWNSGYTYTAVQGHAIRYDGP